MHETQIIIGNRILSGSLTREDHVPKRKTHETQTKKKFHRDVTEKKVHHDANTKIFNFIFTFFKNNQHQNILIFFIFYIT
jgi:hypothetical protein